MDGPDRASASRSGSRSVGSQRRCATPPSRRAGCRDPTAIDAGSWPGATGLRSAAAWAGLTGAQLSDVALRRRSRGAADWLGHIAGALLSRRSATREVLPASRMRTMDGTSISRAGDDGTTRRIHASFDPATACFTDLQPTGAEGGEGCSRFSFARGDLASGDRFYAKPPGLQHVLRSGADFLVRVARNSPRPPFPARSIIFRQHEEASARTVREAVRQHGKKRSGMPPRSAAAPDVPGVARTIASATRASAFIRSVSCQLSVVFPTDSFWGEY